MGAVPQWGCSHFFRGNEQSGHLLCLSMALLLLIVEDKEVDLTSWGMSFSQTKKEKKSNNRIEKHNCFCIFAAIFGGFPSIMTTGYVIRIKCLIKNLTL